VTQLGGSSLTGFMPGGPAAPGGPAQPRRPGNEDVIQGEVINPEDKPPAK